MFNTSLTHDREADLRLQREQRLQARSMMARGSHISIFQCLKQRLAGGRDLLNALRPKPNLAGREHPSLDLTVPDGRMALVFRNASFHAMLPPGPHRIPALAERMEVRLVLPGTAARLSSEGQEQAHVLPYERALRYLDGTLVEILRHPMALAAPERETAATENAGSGVRRSPADASSLRVLRDLPALLSCNEEDDDAVDSCSFV